ncbi:hypothetical protein GGR53DRAFT_475975 [Hypoxylon sp. FL1150]|nr:hypothetical protein GGR53DRAFT_475975 [Hypoxylon sp. FL1150]
MSLSTESIIGIVALLVMCVPGLQFLQRQWIRYNLQPVSRRGILPTAHLNRRLPSPSPDGFSGAMPLEIFHGHPAPGLGNNTFPMGTTLSSRLERTERMILWSSTTVLHEH